MVFASVTAMGAEVSLGPGSGADAEGLLWRWYSALPGVALRLALGVDEALQCRQVSTGAPIHGAQVIRGSGCR